MASKRIKGITVEIGGDTTQLDKALKGTNDKIKDASANLRDVERLLKMDPGNLDLIKQKQKLLSDAIGETEEKLKVLKTAQEQAADALKKGTITPEQYDALGREIIECESSLKRLTSQQQSTDSATSQLTTKINEQKTEINQLKNKYSDLLIEQGGTSEEAQALKDKIEKLSDELSTNENKLKNAKDAANKLGDEFKDTDKNAENLGGEMDTAAKKAEKAGNGGFTVLKGTLSNLASEGIQKVAGGFKDMVESVFDSAVDFESAWTGVTKTVDGTKEQYEKLQSDLWGISQSTASSITDIAQIAENAGQLGIATDDVANFTKIMTMLGDTTNLSADEASSAIAKLANITGLDSSQYSNLGSAIVDLGNNFATTEADIVEMTTRLASTANIAGFSTSDVLAMATALNSVGIEAEAGGTAISKTIKQMQTAIETGWWKKPTNKSAGVSLEDIAKIANVTESEFKKLAKSSPAKALALFIDGLSDTKRNGKSALVVLNDLGITEVRQSNALLALTKSNGLLTKAVNTSSKAWDDNTALTNEANKRYGTTASKIQQTKNRVEELKVQLGNKMLPTIEKVLDVIDKKAPKIEKVLEGVFEKGADLVSFCVDNAGTIEKTFVGVGSILTAGFAINKISTFTNSVSSLVGKFKGLNDNLSGTGSLLKPFRIGGAVALGIGAISGIVAAVNEEEEKWQEHLQKITEKTAELTPKQQELADKTSNTFQAFEDFNESKSNTISNTTDEWNYYKLLKEKLEGITSETGLIQEGQESVAKGITEKLTKATGIEFEFKDGMIQHYDDVMGKIDQTIEKQKALALNTALEDDYQDASLKLKDASQAYSANQQNVKKIQAEYNKLIEDRNFAEDMLANKLKRVQYYTSGHGADLKEMRKAQSEALTAQKKLDEINAKIRGYDSTEKDENGKFKGKLKRAQQDLEDATQAYVGYKNTISQYNLLDDAINQNDVKKMTTAVRNIQNNFITASSGTKKIMEQQVTDAKKNMTNLVQNYSDGVDGITSEMVTDAREYVNQTSAELAKFNLYNLRKEYTTTKTYTQSDWLGMRQDALNNLNELQTLYDNKSPYVTKAMVDEAEKMVTKIDGKLSNLKSISQQSIDLMSSKMVTEIKSKSPEVYTAIETLIQKSEEKLRSGDTKSAGKYFVEGFMLGIQEELAAGNVESAIVNLANMGVSTLKRNLKIASPSKVTAEIGGFFTEGLSVGILSEKKGLTDAVKEITNMAIDGIGNTSQFKNVHPQLTAITAGTMRTPQTSDTTSSRIGSDILAALSRLSIPAPNVTLGDTMLFIDSDEVAARIEYRQKSRQIRTNGRG